MLWVLASLALRPSADEPKSSLQPPKMPPLTQHTIAAVESNHTAGSALPIEGSMNDVLNSVAKTFRPEEAFKSAAQAVQNLPEPVKEKVKADVQQIVKTLPPELASAGFVAYLQADGVQATIDAWAQVLHTVATNMEIWRGMTGM